jgi:hypothetical protein
MTKPSRPEAGYGSVRILAYTGTETDPLPRQFLYPAKAAAVMQKCSAFSPENVVYDPWLGRSAAVHQNRRHYRCMTYIDTVDGAQLFELLLVYQAI